MSAVPGDFMRDPVEIRIRRPQPAERESERDDVDTPAQKFWMWFALGALLFCWIAEATLCAVRGF